MTMTSQDRKAELVRRGVRQAEIARRLGLSKPFVSDVIAGFRRSARVETAVAEALDMDPADVFPPRQSAAA